jgi:hypothetical protein
MGFIPSELVDRSRRSFRDLHLPISDLKEFFAHHHSTGIVKPNRNFDIGLTPHQNGTHGEADGNKLYS